MGYDRYRAGEIVTATKLNSMIPQYVLQINDLSKTNSTLANTDISFTVEANASYYYEMLISYGAIQAADIRWAWSIGSATITSFKRFVVHQLPASSDGVEVGNNIVMRNPAYNSPSVAGGGNAAAPTDAFMSAWDRGVIIVGGTGGTITLQFAQGTTNATASVFRGGNNSRLVYQRIA